MIATLVLMPKTINPKGFRYSAGTFMSTNQQGHKNWGPDLLHASHFKNHSLGFPVPACIYLMLLVFHLGVNEPRSEHKHRKKHSHSPANLVSTRARHSSRLRRPAASSPWPGAAAWCRVKRNPDAFIRTPQDSCPISAGQTWSLSTSSDASHDLYCCSKRLQ